MIAKSKPAVGYIRMSTDRQEDSPARQRRDIEVLAERNGYRVMTWYEDHGLTGTESANRPEFRRLLSNAKNGKFVAVLLSEQSRMSREDVFDAMQHWKLLRDAGVKIVTCQRGELDFSNLGGVITAIVDQYGAREESIKLAHRVVSGQKLKAKQGQRIGGVVYGYDREIYDETGKLVKRVRYDERFKKPPSWRAKLVITDNENVADGIRWAFKAVLHGESVAAIVREFNRRGMKTLFGHAFSYSSTIGILKNPAYAGTLRVGHYGKGKFTTIAEDGVIIFENAHEGMITQREFDRVQMILEERRTALTRSKPGSYLLSPIVSCQHCGIRMYGIQRKQHRKSLVRFYHCNTCPYSVPYSPDCPHPAVRADRLEGFVLQQIRERLLEAGAEAKIRKAIENAKRRETTSSSKDEKILAELQRKIERGTENLALADSDDFQAISKLLNRWKEEAEAIQERIDHRNRSLEPIPEALSILSRYKD
ncbi:MAG: recombinase family protein, partial [Planctomycetes bacterium]|nr:recombinase family protein [Planctomycetota bacterium]